MSDITCPRSAIHRHAPSSCSEAPPPARESIHPPPCSHSCAIAFGRLSLLGDTYGAEISLIPPFNSLLRVMGFSLFCCTSAKPFDLDADEKHLPANGHHSASTSATATATADPRTSAPTPTKTSTSPSKSTSKVPKGPKGKPEPFTPARAQELFDAYADQDDKDVIGPEGFERLCGDAELALDGALPLLLSWQLDASDMGQITKVQWMNGTSSLQYVWVTASSRMPHDKRTC
jgi:hypothetical protein